MSDTSAVTIFVVDDEADVTRGLCWLLESIRVQALAFNEPRAFLAALAVQSGPACVVLDLRMPGLSGLEVMEQVRRSRPDVPVVFLTAHGDVPSAVQVMKQGAVDFLQKPFNPQLFLECVGRSARLAREWHDAHASARRVDQALAQLSAREQEVFRHLLDGASSKEIGRLLAISPKTVDVHRANVLRKLDVPNVRALARRFQDRARVGA